MWQTIEYKAAAIEQFRKGDLLQRVIDDVQSEAANAAEMKAAASGNPLILMQVKLSSDLRKLEALYSQHQRSQHRLRDRLKWLSSAPERLAKAETVYSENIKKRDTYTHTRMEKGKERIVPAITVDGRVLTEKDEEAMKQAIRGGVSEVSHSSKKAHIGVYRGFDVHMQRSFSGDTSADGFRFTLTGAGDQEFHPENLLYSFNDKFSLSGFFQRMDNFLDKGMEQLFHTFKTNVGRELAELETVKAALGQDFPQKDDLALTRENHGAVMRELQRMQAEPNYVSTWEPKTSLADAHGNTVRIANIAIIGSRTFDDYQLLESIVLNILKEKDVKLSELTVVSGGAKGADSLGRDFAEKHGTKYMEFLPDWEKFGKSAGFIRNADIVKSSDFVVALWDGQSKGTRHSLSLAQKTGKPYYAYNFVTNKEAVLAEQEELPQEALLQNSAQAIAQAHNDEAEKRFSSAQYADNKFMDAGFSANYERDGSLHSYKKYPQPTGDGGEIIISIEPRENGIFAVRSEYEKNRIGDARRNQTATANAVDEALEIVANYEKHLLPKIPPPAEAAPTMMTLRMR